MNLSSLKTSAKSSMSWINSQRSAVDDAVNGISFLKPMDVQGINGFVFDYDAEANLSFSAEITDHYVEDNTTIQDHIAMKPIRVTLTGYIGELVYRKPSGLAGALESLQNTLQVVPAYLGAYTPGITQQMSQIVSSATNILNTVDQTLSRVNNLVNVFAGVTQFTKQEEAYQDLRKLYLQRAPFQLQTPFQILENMVIESVVFFQGSDTKTESDITVTLKQIRTVSVVTSSLNKKQFDGRAQQQRQSKLNLGINQGVTKDTSGTKLASNLNTSKLKSSLSL